VERTATGTIVDQTPKTEPTSTTTQPTTKTESAPTGSEANDGKSILNKGQKEAPTGAPEAYTEFKVPEGFTLDETVSKEAGEMFKKAGLTQDAAQGFVDFYVAKAKEAAEAPIKYYMDMQEQWQNEIKADKEIGGKLDAVKATVSKALDGLGDPQLANEFRAAMDLTGAGNHPAFVKAFYKMAQKLTEGGIVTGRGPSAAGQTAPGQRPATIAGALFPNLPSSRG
jgi:hypothetical protein